MRGVAFATWQRCVCFGLTVLLGLLPALKLEAADLLPVQRIVLYKHGMAFFERQGRVADGDQVQLDFKTSDIGDVLKSLLVTDTAGGKITGIRFDSNVTLPEQLNRFTLNIGQGEPLSAFLDRLRGAKLSLKSQGQAAVSGVIFGARVIHVEKPGEEQAGREQVTLYLDSGELRTFDLREAEALTFLEPGLQRELSQYLSTVAQAKARDKRTVYVDTAGMRGRNLRVTYVTPAAIWKSSYRLSLADGNSQLEGWAVVDNTTDEDWNDVKLSVVSGRPISFISSLDAPRYGQRQVAELPEDRAAGPQVYGATMEQSAALGTGAGGAMGTGSNSGVIGGAVGGVPGVPVAQAQTVAVDGTGSGAGGGSAGGAYRIDSTKQFTAPHGVVTKAELEQSSIVAGAAAGASLGELFEYRFGGTVSIKKQQSAMLPFLQDSIRARKLLIYTEQDGEHPVNAAEITNTSAKTLDGGPITVFDANAYAGEALFETVKAGDKRLVGYAVDYGTNVSTAFSAEPRTVRELHVRDGVAELSYRDRSTRTYSLRNADAQAKTLVIQQEGSQDYAVLSPTPSERTATAYRFEVKLMPRASRTFTVQEERTSFNSLVLAESAPDALVAIVENKNLNATSRGQLRQVLEAKSALRDLVRRLDVLRKQMDDANTDQGRIRQNIDSLNQVKGEEQQVRAYVAQLAQKEKGLNELRTTWQELSERRPTLEAAVAASIQKLQF